MTLLGDTRFFHAQATMTPTNLTHLNIEFINFRESIDTGGPLGRTMIVINGGFGNSERIQPSHGASGKNVTLSDQIRLIEGDLLCPHPVGC